MSITVIDGGKETAAEKEVLETQAGILRAMKMAQDCVETEALAFGGGVVLLMVEGNGTVTSIASDGLHTCEIVASCFAGAMSAADALIPVADDYGDES